MIVKTTPLPGILIFLMTVSFISCKKEYSTIPVRTPDQPVYEDFSPKLLWKKSIKPTGDYFTNDLMLVDSLLLAYTDQARLLAFNVNTGEKVWELTTSSTIIKLPAARLIEGKLYFLGLQRGEVIVIDYETGDLLDRQIPQNLMHFSEQPVPSVFNEDNELYYLAKIDSGDFPGTSKYHLRLHNLVDDQSSLAADLSNLNIANFTSSRAPVPDWRNNRLYMNVLIRDNNGFNNVLIDLNLNNGAQEIILRGNETSDLLQNNQMALGADLLVLNNLPETVTAIHTTDNSIEWRREFQWLNNFHCYSHLDKIFILSRSELHQLATSNGRITWSSENFAIKDKVTFIPNSMNAITISRKSADENVAAYYDLQDGQRIAEWRIPSGLAPYHSTLNGKPLYYEQGKITILHADQLILAYENPF